MSASVDDVRVSDSQPDPPQFAIDRLAGWLWAVPVAASPGWVTYALGRSDPAALLTVNAEASPGIALMHMLAGALVVAGAWAWLARRSSWLTAVLATRFLLLGPIALA